MANNLTGKDKEVTEIPAAKPVSTDALVDIIVHDVTAAYNSKMNGGEIRNLINSKTSAYAASMDQETKKEFSKLLREKFERLRQFAELSHQEIINITSQIGW